MSVYNGRKGPNVSRYVANLNTIPAQLDTSLDEPLNLESSLALFTDNDFIDWNGGGDAFDPSSAVDFDLDIDPLAPVAREAGASRESEPKMELSNYEFADLPGFNSHPLVDPSIQAFSHSQTNAYPVSANFTSPVSASVSPVNPGFDHPTGKKRKLGSVDLNSQQAIDEAARVAAEEDKRRRNTAASARFRVKKKQREQALEKTAKEMTDRVTLLENRIQQLETENTWLKGLITEKNGGKASASEINAILKKREEHANERSRGSHTDGVGTQAEDTKA